MFSYLKLVKPLIPTTPAPFFSLLPTTTFPHSHLKETRKEKGSLLWILSLEISTLQASRVPQTSRPFIPIPSTSHSDPRTWKIRSNSKVISRLKTQHTLRFRERMEMTGGHLPSETTGKPKGKWCVSQAESKSPYPQSHLMTPSPTSTSTFSSSPR